MSNKLKYLNSLIPSPTHHFQTLKSKQSSYSLTFPTDSSVTKQSFGPECDINTIMARYQSTGEMPVINQVAPQYLELDQTDFQQAMEVVAGAQSLFAELPSALRTRFNNNPGEFLAFTTNPDNIPEMKKLGMFVEQASTPAAVPAVPAAQPNNQPT